MKLIIAGATGFVATELIRQSLRKPGITSVVALARRPVAVPEDLGAGADPSKLQSVVLEDFGVYSDDVRKQIAGADACIWSLAITPTKSKTMEFDHVRKVCHDYTITGLKEMFEARNQTASAKPFRFLYMSGIAAERDPTKKPSMMPEYCWMRGEVENQVLAFTAEHQGQIESSVAKPGLINKPGLNMKNVLTSAASFTGFLPNILVTEISAAMLDQVVNGFDKEPLMNDDLVQIGARLLKEES